MTQKKNNKIDVRVLVVIDLLAHRFMRFFFRSTYIAGQRSQTSAVKEQSKICRENYIYFFPLINLVRTRKSNRLNNFFGSETKITVCARTLNFVHNIMFNGSFYLFFF